MFGAGRYLLGEPSDRVPADGDAFKVAFFQDEFYFCRQRFEFVNEIGVDLIYTHVHPEDIPRSGAATRPRARARFNYPGYVDSEMVAAAQRFARPDERA